METPLLPGNDGLFCLCIHGVASLTDKVVNEIFSKYGEVKKISRSGNNLGFVRYQEYDEAKAAMDAMQSHPSFRVNPAHIKSNSTRSRTDGWNYGERNNTDERNDTARSSNDRMNTDRYGHDNGRTTRPRRPKSRTPSYKGESDDSKNSMPPLKFTEGIPDLVPQGDPAKQLIIANLPPHTMQFQVYNLCKPIKVLHVDVFTTYSNITYAHVHVRRNEDVKELERVLNGAEIDGKKVVAISIDKLLTEYSTPGQTPVTGGRK